MRGMPDWNCKQSVINWLKARRWKGMTVIKVPSRLNFNVVHTSRTDLYDPSWVVYQQ